VPRAQCSSDRRRRLPQVLHSPLQHVQDTVGLRTALDMLLQRVCWPAVCIVIPVNQLAAMPPSEMTAVLPDVVPLLNKARLWQMSRSECFSRCTRAHRHRRHACRLSIASSGSRWCMNFGCFLARPLRLVAQVLNGEFNVFARQHLDGVQLRLIEVCAARALRQRMPPQP